MMRMSRSNKMTIADYKQILDFYKIAIPSSKAALKKQAEQILAEKLCKCIKNVGLKDEPKSIRICTTNIFNTKGLSRGAFKCKKTQRVSFSKQKTRKSRNYRE